MEVGGSAPPDDGAGGLCTALGERLLGLFRAARHRGQRALGGLGAVEAVASGRRRPARGEAVRPDELPEDDPGEPDRDRARGGSSEETSDEDFERDRSESETARCSVDGDDRADQCSALASPWTESQCVGSLLSCRRMGTIVKSFSQTEPSAR